MLRLYISRYQCGNAARQEELETCLQHNENNAVIDEIVNVATVDNRRPAYNQFFQIVNNVTGPDDINVIANADIFFDDTLKYALEIPDDRLYALSRHDIMRDSSIKHCDRYFGFSQDVWIWRGAMRPVNATFPIGVLGCDSRIAHILSTAGYKLSDCCFAIRAYHLHMTDFRTYSMKYVVPGERLDLPFSKDVYHRNGDLMII